jgi:hypothetical protein
MTVEIFLRLTCELFSLLIHSHFLTTQNFQLFSQYINPFLDIVNGVTSLGEIDTNDDFCFGEVFLVD